MNIDGFDGDINVTMKPNSETRQIQIQGRIDVPDSMLSHLGLGHKDNVMVMVNNDRDCIEIHRYDKAEEAINGGE